MELDIASRRMFAEVIYVGKRIRVTYPLSSLRLEGTVRRLLVLRGGKSFALEVQVEPEGYVERFFSIFEWDLDKVEVLDA